MVYDPKVIEPKWIAEWEKSQIYKAEDFGSDNRKQITENGKPKYYVLFEFPYPSGDRLHVGHGRSYSALDALARKKRMQGYNVLLPMGWDAFGLPAENYAIKMKTTPQKIVPENIKHAREQAKSWGLSVDWSREVDTTDPAYYRWTQWIFVQMYKKGLAYSASMPINWCPQCKIGLANEEVVGGNCERCGTATEKRNVKQWVLRITDYADRLIDDLETVDYPEKIKALQRNWVGRSEGTNVKFKIYKSVGTGRDLSAIEVFTTRVDTIYGVTAVVLAPEHAFIEALVGAKTLNPLVGVLHEAPPISRAIRESPLRGNINEVIDYVAASKRKSEMDRSDSSKEKTGVFTGLYAINPVNGEKIPVWVGDYVIGSYGGGAVMVVPAHDTRDFQFAQKYDLPIIPVIVSNATLVNSLPSRLDRDVGAQRAVPENSESVTGSARPDKGPLWGTAPTNAYTDYGILINSGPYDGLTSEAAMVKITADLEARGLGQTAKHYHLRDWIFSRQHYWGEPIPLINCDKCGIVPVPEADLPVVLPEVENYEPTGNMESPLAAVTDWVNVTCPQCGGPARRDTDTMPNWAGSNWYFLGYIVSQHLHDVVETPDMASNGRGQEDREQKTEERNEDRNVKSENSVIPLHSSSHPSVFPPLTSNIFSANRALLDYWLPVDVYNGGMEHTTLHLLYSRFVYKFLSDIGVVPGVEPYAKRRSHGVVLSYDGEKMSKSRGNVVNPDDVVNEFGADTFRIYEMFMGPFEQMIAWNPQGVVGVNKFLHRVWKLVSDNREQITDSRKQITENKNVDILLNNLVRKVNNDLDEDTLKFNTAVAAFMTFINNIDGVIRESPLQGNGPVGANSQRDPLSGHDSPAISKSQAEIFLRLLAPFAPFMTEELWHILGHTDSIHTSAWPQYNPDLVDESNVNIVIQINGKMRGKLTMGPKEASDQGVVSARALSDPKVQEWLSGEVKKTIFVPGRLVNFVV